MNNSYNFSVQLLHSVCNSGLELILFSKIRMLPNNPYHCSVLLFCSSDTICRALVYCCRSYVSGKVTKMIIFHYYYISDIWVKVDMLSAHTILLE